MTKIYLFNIVNDLKAFVQKQKIKYRKVFMLKFACVVQFIGLPMVLTSSLE
jgi:hypothetical protein